MLGLIIYFLEYNYSIALAGSGFRDIIIILKGANHGEKPQNCYSR